MKRANTEVSRATIGRVPVYLDYLKKSCSDAQYISATSLARGLGLGEVQVRKDLGAVSGAGRPKIGYNVKELILSLESFLAPDKNSTAVIVGAGKLGRALLDYAGFEEYGLNIAAAFDINPPKGSDSNGKTIYPLEKLADFCEERSVGIGIITVPKQCAQETADRLVECGVKAIWSFAPCELALPTDIRVRYENMALSLAYLNKLI